MQALALMVSRRCNMACRHCSVASGPQIREEPSRASLLTVVRDAARSGVSVLQVTGGEPMVRESLVLELLGEAKGLGLRTHMTTNGFWGRSPSAARRKLRALRRAGLTSMTVSYDRYHAEFQGPEPALNIASAAGALGFSVNINIVRERGDPGLSALVAPFEGLPSALLRFYDVQPVGRARDFAAEALKVEDQGYCAAAAFPAVTDDGRLTACNGPAYFSSPDSPLIVGDLKKDALHALLARHRDDPILETIRTLGPSRLRRELQSIEGFADFPFRKSYGGLCDLCLHITSDPRAVAALQNHLAQPRPAAERVAARRVIEGVKAAGSMSWAEVNGPASRRILFRAARSPKEPFRLGDERVLGRADLDWSRLAGSVIAGGLSRPLLPALQSDFMRKWAPSFFIERVSQAALREGMRELVQREALENVAATLDELGVRGVVLKGGIFLPPSGADDAKPRRSTGDLDVLVPESAARELRLRLLARGWSGNPAAPRSAPHHLAPVGHRGVLLEIHTRLMPDFWGLPEQDMLEAVQPLPGWGNLHQLDAEGFLLHAGVHSATTLFSTGLKPAWDLAETLRAAPSLDWSRLEAWAARCRAPRAFWTPIRVLGTTLGMRFPETFLAAAPTDERQKRLDLIARHRLFLSVDGPLEVNPWSKTAVFLLLHDSLRSRVGYISSILRGSAREARRASADHAPSLDRLARQWREAAGQWRSYRQASRRAITAAVDFPG